MEKKPVTRRDFIRLAGLAAGAGVLAACTPETVVETVVVKETEIVTEEKIVESTKLVEVTAVPEPTEVPAPAVLDVWFNTTIPDLSKEWIPPVGDTPGNDEFTAQWYFGGLGRAIFNPWLEAHPGVSMNITTHSWDWDLRQNQLMAMAAGLDIDTTYGEAYVNEFVQLGVYQALDQAVADKFASGTYQGALVDGMVYGLAKSSGADVLFVNLDKVIAAGMDPTKLPTTWDELVILCQEISKTNANDPWGNTCFYTYGPGGDSYGQAMRILHWFNQAGVPLGSDVGVPSANTEGAADVWLFHNQLMWTSTENLILQAESEAGSGKLFNDGVIAVKPGWNNDATSVGTDNINATAIQFPIPAGGKPATIVIGNDMHSAFKSGKNPDLAKVLVEESLVNEDAQAFLADNCGILDSGD